MDLYYQPTCICAQCHAYIYITFPLYSLVLENFNQEVSWVGLHGHREPCNKKPSNHLVPEQTPFQCHSFFLWIWPKRYLFYLTMSCELSHITSNTTLTIITGICRPMTILIHSKLKSFQKLCQNLWFNHSLTTNIQQINQWMQVEVAQIPSFVRREEEKRPIIIFLSSDPWQLVATYKLQANFKLFIIYFFQNISCI